MRRRLALSVFLCAASAPLLRADPSDRQAFFHRFGLDAAPASDVERKYLDHNHDLYASSAASPAMRRWIEERMKEHAQLRSARERASGRKAAPSPAAPSRPEVYAYPNPSKGRMTFHVETPPADLVEVRVTTLGGRRVHEGVLEETSALADGKRVYEGVWEAGGRGSGTYLYVITARGGEGERRWSGKCAVVR